MSKFPKTKSGKSSKRSSLKFIFGASSSKNATKADFAHSRKQSVDSKVLWKNASKQMSIDDLSRDAFKLPFQDYWIGDSHDKERLNSLRQKMLS